MGDHLLDRIATAVHDPGGELGVVRLAQTPLAAGRARQYEPDVDAVVFKALR
jgi:hypothetical protein